MNRETKDFQLLFPDEFTEQEFISQKSSFPFDDAVVEFLNELSKEINKDPEIRQFPDVATFAFFCRKANILKAKKTFATETSLSFGRGLVFHITPSNVPVNFAYSLVAGLIAGNANIVRVPSKDFEQIRIIVHALNRMRSNNDFKSVTNKITLVRYDRQSDVTGYFSSLCDVRIIWGGDDTIDQIRKNKLKPRAFDITFADRYSFCVINADEFINEPDPGKLANNFYNDTYLFDQNACSAPHLVVWLGTKKNIERSKKLFWENLKTVVDQKYAIQPVMSVDKLTAFQIQAINLDSVTKTNTDDNLLWRIKLSELPDNIEMFRCAGGYFSEYDAKSLDEIAPIINSKYQTMAYYGIPENQIKEFMKRTKPAGIDRIVPIGKTTDFSFFWDGYNLISTLSRECQIV